jgi:hypothetical protein
MPKVVIKKTKIKVKKKIKKKVKKQKEEDKKEITIDDLKINYINSMDEKEKIAYKIAKEHLGSSFNLEKSIGFQKWLKKNSNNI